MSAPQLLQRLRTSGIRISRRGESLWVEPRTAVTPDLANELRAHKPELLATLDRAVNLFNGYAKHNDFTQADIAQDLPPILQDPIGWIAYLKGERARHAAGAAQVPTEPVDALLRDPGANSTANQNER